MNTEDLMEMVIQEYRLWSEFEPDSQCKSDQAILRVYEKLRFPNYVLAVSCADYLVSLGGTEKVQHEEQEELLKRNISYIQIYPYQTCQDFSIRSSTDQLIGVNIDSNPVGVFTIMQLGLVLQILNRCRITNPVAIHVHHLLRFSFFGIKNLITVVCAKKLRIFVHDYYTVCQQFNLLRNGEEFCGDLKGNVGDCRNCKLGDDRILHASKLICFFKGLDAEIITPSKVAANIWGKCYPDHQSKIRVIPHQIIKQQSDSKLKQQRLNNLNSPSYLPKIAYLGYESMIKGLETWWRLISEQSLSKKYRFFHLGTSGMNFPSVAYIPVSILSDGPEAMIRALKKNNIDIAFLWSLCPETYSFTLHESFAANCFVVTNKRSGNIAERIKETQRGIVFDNETEMLSFFNDVSGVKQLVAKNLEQNSFLTLKFNPQLSVESGEYADPRYSLISDADILSVLKGYDKEFDYLFKKLEIETIRTAQIQLNASLSVAQDANDLRAQLDVYHISKLHRMVESFRHQINKHPVFASIMRKVLKFFWDIFASMKAR